MVAEKSSIARLNHREYAQCELTADLALVSEVAAQVRIYCLRHGLDSATWAEVELALVEGLNNAIEHGCRDLPDGPIRVSWNWTDEILHIEIADPGQFLPAPLPVELPDPLSEGGRGQFVISRLMDSVSHETREGQHVLVLQKRVGLPARADAEVESTLAGMTGELINSYETITALFGFSEELATAQSFDVFFEHVRRRLLKLVEGDEVWLRLDDPCGKLKLVDPGETKRSPGLPAFLSPADDAVEQQVFRDLERQTVEECSALRQNDPLWRQSGSALVCPITFRDTALGVLTVLRARSNYYFTAEETRLIATVAEYLGIARTMALAQEQQQAQQRTERELELAAEIQRSLLPNASLETTKFRVFGLSQMANEVGGDYFDVLPIEGKGVLLVIADVMGKGMPAALLATILRTSIRSHTHLAEAPGRLLTVVNRQLAADLNNLGMFITAQIAFLPDAMDQLIFASAGHCPLLKTSPGAAQVALNRGGGVPLGVLDEAEYESMQEPMAAGDRLIMLTDGVYEVESPSGEILWLDPLVRLIPTLCTGDPRNCCKGLLDYVAAYSAGTPAADDRTLLIAQYL